MESHLLQMRGLKQSLPYRHYRPHQSHLLQMRGLKPLKNGLLSSLICRIFYRCVD